MHYQLCSAALASLNATLLGYNHAALHHLQVVWRKQQLHLRNDDLQVAMQLELRAELEVMVVLQATRMAAGCQATSSPSLPSPPLPLSMLAAMEATVAMLTTRAR